MQSTFVHPVGRPNLCFCGHDLRRHNLLVAPNQCFDCIPSASGAVNIHPFTSHSTILPVAFPASDLPRTVNAGGLGRVIPSATTSASGNTVGGSTMTLTGISSNLRPGMTVTTLPSNIGNSQTYTIAGINGNVLTLSSPLRIGANNTLCIFGGSGGSGMGPGRPPNGQRAG